MTERFALLFPGQGSQFVGMGKSLLEESATARHLLEQADETLGYPLTKCCVDGPEEVLRETSQAQPAILAISVAALAVLREAAGDELSPAFVAGHSLGEFSALVAAQALDYGDALRLVRRRGELMSDAGRAQQGAMAAVLGAEDGAVEEACREASEVGTVVVANYNAAGQVVISGEPQAVQRAGELAKAKGARRVVPLPVSGAFHSPLMASAAGHFGEAVTASAIADPRVPVVSNVDVKPLVEAEAVRHELQRQIIAPVRWAQTLRFIAGAGVSLFVEIGPGQVLTGLAKRVPGVRTANVDSPASARALVAEWRITA